MSPYITPSSKVLHHNTQGSPGSHQISLSEMNGIKRDCIDMASCSWVFAMELHHFSSHMELVMHMPAIVTIIVSLPQVLKVIVPHLTV
jgi:hypothetical protein